MVKKSTKVKSANIKKSISTLKKPRKTKTPKEEVIITVREDQDPPIKKEVVKKTTKKKTVAKKTTTKKETTKKAATKKTTKKAETKKTTKKTTTKKTTAKKVTKPKKKLEKAKKAKIVKIDKEEAKNKALKILHSIGGFFKILGLIICKIFLNLLKGLKKLPRKLYNGIKTKIENIKSKIKIKEIKDKKEKNKKETKIIQESNKEDDIDLSKLSKKERKKYLLNADSYTDIKKIKYKETSFLLWIPAFFVNRAKVIGYDMKRFGKRIKYGTWKDRLLIIIMLGLIAGFSCLVALCIYVIATAPEINEKRLYKSNSTILLDKDGNEFARLGSENREKVTYDEIPEVLVDAIIATEDSRFFQHNGVDIARFTKAAFGQVLGHSDSGGGSTLTMQVSKNAATNTKHSGIEGIIRKFTDIYLSVFVFEKQYTKEQIMEFYVNIPNLGAGSYGVQQASKIYFGKEVSELNLAEAAMIAGLFQGPSAYNPYVHPERAENRRQQVLGLMLRHGYITQEEYEAAKSVNIEDLLVGIENTGISEYIGFIDTVVSDVKDKTGNNPDLVSMTVYTTLDPEKQKGINNIYNTYNFKNEYSELGMVIEDVPTGAIVAIGTGRNLKKIERGYNYATDIHRHPGSTAKPVLDYGPAFEYLGWSTSNTVIDDEYTYSGGGKIKNWDNKYDGVTTAKAALARSRNIPALYTFQQTTNEQKLEFATNLGWRPETDTRGENLSAKTPQDIKGRVLETCSIGGFEGVSPVEAASAYGAFARGGTYIEPYTFTKVIYSDTGEEFNFTPKKVQVMDEGTAYLVTVALRYAVTGGTINVGKANGAEVAAKTGTSTVDGATIKALGLKGNIIGDSWEVNYSSSAVIALWYGYPSIDSEHYLLSSEGGTARNNIGKQLATIAHAKNATFTKPASVKTATVELGTSPLQLASDYTPADLKETAYFREGTVPTETSTRFSKLGDINNLRASSTATSVTLSWDAAPTPDQKNDQYLRNYFNNDKSAYKPWADKYYQERVNYNNSVFGDFGYRVYMVTAAGATEIGFTTNTTFTTNVQFNTATRFIVKASYRNFTANMSNGKECTVNPNSSGNTGASGDQTIGSISLGLSIKPTINQAKSLNYADYVTVNGKTVSQIKASGETISLSVEHRDRVSNNKIEAANLQCSGSYRTYITVSYKGKTAQINKDLSGC